MTPTEQTMGRILAVLAEQGHDGMTAGLISRRVGITSSWCYKLLTRLINSGDVYRCELPHGYNNRFTKVLYFTVNRMMEMNSGKLPEAGKVYVIRQRVATEIIGTDGENKQVFSSRN